MNSAVPVLAVAKPSRLVDWLRAWAKPPQISKHRAVAVLEPFGSRLTSGPENLSLGWRNRNVVVHTTGGKRVLKQYRETSNRDTIAHEHSIIGHLNRNGFPSVRLNHTATGESVVAVEDQLYALFDFEAGRHYAASFMSQGARNSLRAVAGRTLGRLHLELTGFRPSGLHHLGFDTSSGERTRDLAWHLHMLEQLVSDAGTRVDGDAAASIAWLRASSELVHDSLHQLAEVLGTTDLPLTVIHGDYGLHNLLFRRDGTAVVHDFELARVDWRLLDVAIVLSRFGPRGGEAFLSGYRQAHELPPSEVELLPVIWRYHLLSGAVRSWYGYHEFGGHERLATARARITEAEAETGPGLARWL